MITDNGVKIIGPVNLPSDMAPDASALYAKNLQNLLELMIDDEGKLNVNFDDEIIKGACLDPRGRDRQRAREGSGRRRLPMDLMTEITIFVLAAFVGFEVISKVPTTLHTPLMSQTNAIHGIVVLGGLIVVGYSDESLEQRSIGFIAIAFGTINVVGGFMVTDRMLGMFVRQAEAQGRGAGDRHARGSGGGAVSVSLAALAPDSDVVRAALPGRRRPLHRRPPAGHPPDDGQARQPDRRGRHGDRDRRPRSRSTASATGA